MASATLSNRRQIGQTTHIQNRKVKKIRILYFNCERQCPIEEHCRYAFFTKINSTVPTYADEFIFAKSALIFRSLTACRHFVYKLKYASALSRCIFYLYSQCFDDFISNYLHSCISGMSYPGISDYNFFSRSIDTALT